MNYNKKNQKLEFDNNAKKSHKAFVEHELDFISGIDSKICKAYRNFILKWVPENEIDNHIFEKYGKGIENAKCSFSLGIGKEKLEEDAEIIARYKKLYSERNQIVQDSEIAVCGILGERLKQARVHNKIKFPGVKKAGGAPLVCMNDNAVASYGKKQSYNSNISEEAMKKYTSVLNKLINDKNHNIRIGDMVVIFFALKKNDMAECNLFSKFFSKSNSEYIVDVATENEIQTVVSNTKKGISSDDNMIDENASFIIAGLTPNTSRICQKFIAKNKYGDIILNLKKHQEDLKITDGNSRQIYFYSIVRELISPKIKTEEQIYKELKKYSVLHSDIILAALNNTAYPDALLSTVIRRIKTDSDEENNNFIKINDTRAGIIKACLNRKHKKEEITMSWNNENTNPAYLCGGLFAIFEKIQQESSGGTLNRTIKDSYFSSACSRPSSVFPKLAKLANIHMRKLEQKKQIIYNKFIQQISDGLEGEFPSTLSLDDQGRFIIGYYQMNKKL